MKLAFRSAKDKSATTPSAKAPSATPSGNSSLRSQMMLLIVLGAVLIVIPPVVVYMHTALKLDEAHRKQAELAAGLFASDYQQWVASQVATAERVVKDPQLARLMMEGSESQRTARAESLAYLFPSALRVRLLPPGIEETDPGANPPISYAALDMLRHAESQEASPPMEVHMSGTPQQHVNLVRSIRHPSGSGVVGNLMVSFPVRQLQSLLARAQVDGYAELQQVAGGATLVLGSSGAAGLKQGEADSQVSVSGARWRAAYWAQDSGQGGAALLTTAAAATGVAAVVLISLVWFAFRNISRALSSDQAVLLTITKDMRDGRVRPEYPNSLAELHDTIELMARTARSGMASGGAAASQDRSKNDAKAQAATVVDELAGDLLFSDSAPDASAIEVVDSKISPTIFRAYDIRGVVGETLTPETAYALGRAIGSEAYYRGEQTVVVGRDGRLSGPELADALMRGLQATGRDVKDIGVVPTPVLYFATQYLDSKSGVMVTGSHNPSQYNGFKIVLSGETLASDAIQELRRRIESDDLLTGEGTLEKVDVLPDYVERIKSDVQLARPLKVVVDCGNGVAGVVAPKLLRALGCEVIELFCEVDGNFPNHHPDPSKTENLAPLIQAVQEQGAELGIAFDGDGDRLGIVTAQGDIVWPDRLLMLLAMDVLSRNPGAQIIFDVKCSRHVARVVAEFGGEPLMWATGHSLIKAKMKETGALLAGEMSGHIFFKERWFGFDDALYSAARLLEILASDQRSTSEVFASLPDSMSTPELNVPMAEGEPAAYMEKLLGCAHFDNANITTVDGMRVEFERGWGLVRASNTTPCLVVRFEADDELALHSIQEEFRRVMLQADPGLQLPF